MLEIIMHWLDQVLGRDVDKIVASFNRTNAQLDRLVAREALKRARNQADAAALRALIDELDTANAASTETSERAARIQNRIRELTA